MVPARVPPQRSLKHPAWIGSIELLFSRIAPGRSVISAREVFVCRVRTHGTWDFPRTLRANISETVLVLLINEQGEKAENRNELQFSWCCSFPWGFGCRGTERRRA